jgi:hypothetical protein
VKQSKLTKDQIQKLALSTMGFVVLLYVYFSFFLGPLNRSRATMVATMQNLQGKVGSSKGEMTKATNLERQAGTATERFAALKALSPEGAPIAWFPPRMKVFFANQGIDKVTVRLENSGTFKEPELANWIKNSWVIEMPQTDFAGVGNSIAALENTEPLLTITKINIKAVADAPEFQQVTLAATTALVKR